MIDLLDGMVVHARSGDRKNYQPVHSSLCQSAEPMAVVDALLQLYPFPRMYIADLDAIQGHGNNSRLIHSLSRRFPEVSYWCDQGRMISADAPFNVQPVIGSESGFDPGQLAILSDTHPSLVLSLDFDRTGFIGNRKILSDPNSWPKDVIVMCLDRVGTATGPDLSLLPGLRERHRHGRVFVAGGIGSRADLATCRGAEADGVLLATALHERRITRSDLLWITQKKTPA